MAPGLGIFIFLLVIDYVFSVLNSKCLINSSFSFSTNFECLLCGPGYYLPQAYGNCTERNSSEEEITRVVGITKRDMDKGNTLLMGFDAVYDSLVSAMATEENIANRYMVNNYSIYFKFFKEDHFVLQSDFYNFTKTNFFWRVYANLNFAPFYCENYAALSIAKSLCYNTGEQAKIYLKYLDFNIFIAKKSIFTNISFDGSELAAYFLNESCFNKSELCCDKIEKSCQQNLLNLNLAYNNSVYEREVIGLFLLEPLFDNENIMSYPDLTFKNVKFELINTMVYELIKPKFAYTLILIEVFEGSLQLVNCAFTDSFFSRGIVYKNKEIRQIFQEFILLINNFYATNSSISITKVLVTNYMGFPTIYKTLDGKSSLYSLNNFKGNITLTEGNYSNCSLPESSFLQLEEPQSRFQTILLIQNLIIVKSIFSQFIQIIGFPGRSLLCVNLINNYLLLNLFDELVVIKHVVKFQISGSFNRTFLLPRLSFIVTAYSNLFFTDCIFSDLKVPRGGYYLININSVYSFTLEAIFTDAKRGPLAKFSNDTTSFMNSTFSMSDYLLLTVNKFNYGLNIENCTFDAINTLVHPDLSFIYCVVEARLVLRNTKFKNLDLSGKIILADAFLNASLEHLWFEDIYNRNKHIIHFRSLTLVNLEEHQVLIKNLVFKNILLKNSESLPRLYIVLIDYYESGKGALISMENVYFEDISIEKSPFKNSANYLVASCSPYLKARNVTANNITNFVFFSNEASNSNTSLLLHDVHLTNPIENPMKAIINDGIVSYNRAELINSSFINVNIEDNFAASFTLVNSVFLSSTYFYINQLQGYLLYIFIQSTLFFQMINVTIVSTFESSTTLLTFASVVGVDFINWRDPSSILLNQSSVSGIYSGIFGCSFTASNKGAIVLLPQAEILIFESSFSKMYSGEGAFLQLNTNSRALIYGCRIENTQTFSLGGALSAEDSSIILINTYLYNSKSRFKGGIISIFNCYLIISNSSLENGESAMGGLLFADESRIKITRSTFNNARAFTHGGHFLIKKGTLFMDSCILKNSTSNTLGGSIYIEGAIFEIDNIEILKCVTQVGIIYLSDSLEGGSNFFNSRIVNNTVLKTGASIYLNDFKVEFVLMEFSYNYGENGYLIELTGTFDQIKISFEDCLIKYNNLKTGVFYIKEANVNIKSIAILSNKILNENIFRIVKSRLTIETFFMKNEIKNGLTSKRPFAMIGHFSSVNISLSLLKLSKLISSLQCSDCYKIFVTSSVFLNGSGSDGGCFSLKKSELNAYNIYFGFHQADQGGVFYAVDSVIYIKESCFYKNEASLRGSEVLLLTANPDYNSIFACTVCLFYKIFHDAINSEGGGLRLSSTFIFGDRRVKSQAIYLLSNSILDIENSMFSDFFGAPAILAQTQGTLSNLTIFIKNSLFQNALNLNSSGGFLFLCGNVVVRIENSIFSKSYALNGGAVQFSSSSRNHSSLIIVNTSFYNNRAVQLGGAISSDNFNIVQSNNSFENNSAEVGDDTNFFPTKFFLFRNPDKLRISTPKLLNCESDQTSLYICINRINQPLSIVPGHEFSLGALILDDFGNVQTDQNENYIRMDVCSELRNVSDILRKHGLLNNQVKVKYGVSLFDSLVLEGPPKDEITVCISYEHVRYKLKTNITINVLKCGRGEVFRDNVCFKCAEDYYSLQENEDDANQSCIHCPENAICQGGDVIIPKINFWRKNANSSLIFPCKYRKACINQSSFINSQSKSYEFVCREGFVGNLCEACKEGFAFVKNDCLLCDGTGHVITILLILSGFIIYLFYVLFEEKRSLNLFEDKDATLMKILVNHISVNIMLTAMKVNWSDFFLDFLSMTSMYISTSPSTIFSFDCLFMWTPKERIESKIIIVGLSPIILVALTLLVNLSLSFYSLVFLVLRKKLTEKHKSELALFFRMHLSLQFLIWESLKHLLLIFLNIYPHVLVVMFNVFSCKSLDNTSELYISQYPWLECHSDLHKRLSVGSSIFLLTWGLVFPTFVAIIIGKLYKENSKRKSFVFFLTFIPETTKNPSKSSDYLRRNQEIILNFLVKGYKKKFFWWDFTVFLRKSVLIGLVAFSEDMDAVSIGGLSILILSIILIITLYLLPYESKTINLFEILSLLISICSIGFGVISSFGPELRSDFRTIIYVLLLLLNSFFLAIVIFHYFKAVLEDLWKKTTKRKKLSFKVGLT